MQNCNKKIFPISSFKDIESLDKQSSILPLLVQRTFSANHDQALFITNFKGAKYLLEINIIIKPFQNFLKV